MRRRLQPLAARLLASRRFLTTDLTAEVILAAESLYGVPERGDRLIAATAVRLECPLLTQAPAIARVPSISTIW